MRSGQEDPFRRNIKCLLTACRGLPVANVNLHFPWFELNAEDVDSWSMKNLNRTICKEKIPGKLVISAEG